MSADEPTFYNVKRLHAVFAVSAVALLAVTICAPWTDARRGWKPCQRTFHEQIDLPELTLGGDSGPLGRVDRCMTCHQGNDRTRPGRPGEPACPDAPQPYRSHPRLDLLVGEASPHPMSRFGCTVCHEGQGSATDFVWASHAPNDSGQQARWRQQYGWFRNADWGRKPESSLGFERVANLVAQSSAGDVSERDRQLYLDALQSHRREGFLWQKLRAPRSFDFQLAQDKPYSQWLTMGQFHLTEAEREKVLEKYACAECHALELERWKFRGRQGTAEVVGTPRVEPTGKLLEDEDERGGPLYYFLPWEPAVIDGRTCCACRG